MLCDALLVIDDPSIVSTFHEKGQDKKLKGSHHPWRGKMTSGWEIIIYNSLNLHFTMGNDVVLNNEGLDSDSDAAGNAAGSLD